MPPQHELAERPQRLPPLAQRDPLVGRRRDLREPPVEDRHLGARGRNLDPPPDVGHHRRRLGEGRRRCRVAAPGTHQREHDERVRPRPRRVALVGQEHLGELGGLGQQAAVELRPHGHAEDREPPQVEVVAVAVRESLVDPALGRRAIPGQRRTSATSAFRARASRCPRPWRRAARARRCSSGSDVVPSRNARASPTVIAASTAVGVVVEPRGCGDRLARRRRSTPRGDRRRPPGARARRGRGPSRGGARRRPARSPGRPPRGPRRCAAAEQARGQRRRRVRLAAGVPRGAVELDRASRSSIDASCSSAA